MVVRAVTLLLQKDGVGEWQFKASPGNIMSSTAWLKTASLYGLFLLSSFPLAFLETVFFSPYGPHYLGPKPMILDY